MRSFIAYLLKYMLTGAIIGAILGVALSEGMPEGLPAGTFFGAMVGYGIVAIRIDNRRIRNRSRSRLGTSADEAVSGFIQDRVDRY